MKNNIKSVLFAGAYGIENAGDDLPLVVLCKNLKHLAPHLSFKFHVLSRHPNSWEEKTYGVTMIKNIEYDSRQESAGKWFRGLNYGDDTTQLCRIKDTIQKADVLVFGAGNWLIDLSIDILRGPIPLLALYVFLSKLYHKPIMLYGLSAGPFKTDWGRDLTRWIVESADVVTVRDLQSKLVLQELVGTDKDIHLLPDPTIGATLVSRKRINKILSDENIPAGRKKIAIGLRDLRVVLDTNKTELAWIEIAKFISSLKNTYDFIFIPQSTYPEDDDRITAKKLATYFEKDVHYHIINNRYHPEDLIGIYRCCKLTIAIRLHSAIFSSIAETPVMCISYLPKVTGFMHGMGLQSYVLEPDQIYLDKLMALYDSLMNNYSLLKKNISEAISNKKQEVIQYSKLCLELMRSDK